MEAFYRPLIQQAADRLSGGRRLWTQFDQAVAAFRQHGGRQVIERVNELAVARQLLLDATIASAVIQYEPEIVPGGSKFDFAVIEPVEQCRWP